VAVPPQQYIVLPLLAACVAVSPRRLYRLQQQPAALHAATGSCDGHSHRVGAIGGCWPYPSRLQQPPYYVRLAAGSRQVQGSTASQANNLWIRPQRRSAAAAAAVLARRKHALVSSTASRGTQRRYLLLLLLLLLLAGRIAAATAASCRRRLTTSSSSSSSPAHHPVRLQLQCTSCKRSLLQQHPAAAAAAASRRRLHC
jgi:hypothetical protein